MLGQVFPSHEIRHLFSKQMRPQSEGILRYQVYATQQMEISIMSL